MTITLTAQQLAARHSEADKARAFEWLRTLAVADGAPSEAGIMLDTYAVLADRALNATAQGMVPAAVNIISINGVPTCAHPKERTSIGPTTWQINHYCPDCKQGWTTYPAASSPNTSRIMSKAPDNASGAELETVGYGLPSMAIFASVYEHNAGQSPGCDIPLVRRTDAARLLAEKDAELQRLREALRRIGLIEIDRDYHDPDEMIERGLSAVGQARAALNPKD